MSAITETLHPVSTCEAVTISLVPKLVLMGYPGLPLGSYCVAQDGFKFSVLYLSLLTEDGSMRYSVLLKRVTSYSLVRTQLWPQVLSDSLFGPICGSHKPVRSHWL